MKALQPLTEKIWHTIKKSLSAFLITLIVLGSLIGLIILIIIGYSYGGTGFGASTIPIYPDREIQPEKKLWDWLGLLVIPIVLALSATWFSWAERNNERAIADDRAQEAALQAYFEQMSVFLIDKGLRKSESQSEVRDLARAWTLTFLRRLNGERKGVLLRFLYESELIARYSTVISLGEANLEGASLKSVTLAESDLKEVYLKGANLLLADLSGADLGGADLSKTTLVGANLDRAKLDWVTPPGATRHNSLAVVNLEGANLDRASLRGASLDKAYLKGTNLKRANLERANLEGAYLVGVNLEGAKYSTDTKWPDGFDPKSHGAILIEEE